MKPINKISLWLDEQQDRGLDIAHIDLPEDLAYDVIPDEAIYFKEIRPCGILCARDHPFATVERFGRWYYARGQDKQAGIHAAGMHWKLFTTDRDAALLEARRHIE